MKIGFDIGGVISKYPNQFRRLIHTIQADEDNEYNGHDIYIITDQHPKETVIKTLQENGFYFYANHIYCADYEKYGNMAKAVLIKELGIDMFFDDHDGYLQWDSSLGPQPILLKVMPDAFRPYWADSWKCDGSEFGRIKYATS